ncbi:MAG: ribbon-helix-helix domain-containing protein [Terriglobales bacterium]|jgi:Ribbon-helix-helix domain
MSNTLTVRLPEDLLAWLKDTSKRTGIPVGQLVRQQLETAKSLNGNQRFMRFAGIIKGGPRDVSSRKGFSPK